jgi:Family of unknown function (DUF6152)
MKHALLSFMIVVSFSVTVIHAHHSIVGVYDSSRKVSLEGTIAEFGFVNPHPFLLMLVKDASGTVERWRLELDNKSELAEVGVTRDTFRYDDHVTVSGSPARDGSLSLYVLRLDRPADSFRYEQVGSSPRVVFGKK